MILLFYSFDLFPQPLIPLYSPLSKLSVPSRNKKWQHTIFLIPLQSVISVGSVLISVEKTVSRYWLQNNLLRILVYTFAVERVRCVSFSRSAWLYKTIRIQDKARQIVQWRKWHNFRLKSEKKRPRPCSYRPTITSSIHNSPLMSVHYFHQASQTGNRESSVYNSSLSY